ncbi:MAG: LysR family transcriptional regulator [Bacilli bacterium]|nr:LysR family transcriptional regulator [Bacilli bacterium]
MDIRTLSYFVTIAEELNITKAAEKLCMSQPPLSNQMKSLEEELDTTLFIRGKRHLQLTESGKLLYRHAKEILSLVDKTSEEVRAMAKGMHGKIAIGLVEGSAPIIAAECIETFLKEHKNVQFTVVDGNSDELIQKLRSGLIDLAIITSPCDNTLLSSFKVGQEQMTAFMSKDNPLASLPGSTIDLAMLKDKALIVPSRESMVSMIYRWFKEIHIEPKIVCKMDNYLDVAALAGRNVGISLFPKTSYILNQQIIAKEIVNPERYVEYLFVWLKNKPLSLLNEAFINHVKSFVKA